MLYKNKIFNCQKYKGALDGNYLDIIQNVTIEIMKWVRH